MDTENEILLVLEKSDCCVFLLLEYGFCWLNPLAPNDPYNGRTAPLTSKRCILYIYSTNIGTEYFKHGIKISLNLRGSRNSGKITTGRLSRPQFHLSLLGSLASLRTEAPGG